MRAATARLTAGILAAALLSLLVAATAAAEPKLGIELIRGSNPGDVPQTHEDERAAYKVTVENEASSSPEVGTELTCLGTPADGKSWFGDDVSFTYQWVRNGEEIPAGTSRTYSVAAADEGKSLQCVVRGENEPAPGEPAVAEVASQPPLVVNPQPTTAPPRPVSATSEGSRPRILPTFEGGEPREAGKEITCKAPTEWTGTGITWSFAWLVNGEPGNGTTTQPTATTSKYLILAEDVPSVLQCRVTATDSEGNKAIAISTTNYTVPAPAGGNFGPVNTPSATPSISFSNTTSGPISVEIEAPDGLDTYIVFVRGSGWTCSKEVPTPTTNATATCTRSDALLPKTSYPSIELVERVGADAPDALVTKATVSGGNSASAINEDTVTVGPGIGFGFAEFFTEVLDELGNDYTQAGGHPFSAGATVAFNEHWKAEKNQVGPQVGVRAVNGSAKVIRTDTPRGFVGNVQAIPERCEKMAEVTRKPTGCPQGSVVGGIDIETSEGTFVGEPIYAIEKEFGTPAQFAFGISNLNLAYSLTPELRAEDGYAISLLTSPAPTTPELLAAEVTLCGFGAQPLGISPLLGESQFKGCLKAGEFGANPTPLITNPTRCSGPAPSTRIAAESWEAPTVTKEATFTSPALTGCDQVPFTPAIKFTPSSREADSPTGLDVEITMPTDGLQETGGIAQANLHSSTVTFPIGMSVNPALASGLQACSLQQIGLGNNNDPTCPLSSKVGSAEVSTPLLENPLKGSVYTAQQGSNPFRSLLALYLVFQSPADGITIKIAGKVTPDPVTGQLTASFTENPEAPFSSLELHFGGGPRAALINPPACGKYTINTKLSPWSAADPANPSAAEIVNVNSSYQVNKGPGGAECPPGALEARFAAGLTNPTAGASSPFVLRLARDDGTQRFTGLDVAMPPGLTGYLKGIPYCPEPALAAISGAEGTGTAQLQSPSCPAASQIGTVTASAGAGPSPFYLDTGRAYLAGPYKGAPLSIAIVTPAVAGPFDLGNVVVRAALNVNPTTAQISVNSDPIPTILHGILLDIREIQVNVNRPNFILAPTNCEPMSVGATVTGQQGDRAQLSDRFQVGGCENLKFKPKLQLALKGQMKKSGNPALKAVLTQPSGQANIARTAVILPPSVLIDNAHVNNPCTRDQFAANACPKGSILGTAKAFSPLLDESLVGNVYFRSNGGARTLPDMVAVLKGQVTVELIGFIDSVVNKKAGTARVRNTFAVVPDAPVSRFELNLAGGKRGLIENTRNLCKGKKAKAEVRMNAQNGRQLNLKPAIGTSCKGKKKGKGGKKR